MELKPMPNMESLTSVMSSYTIDLMGVHIYSYNMAFSTKDSDNDSHSQNCAVMQTGAWWYKACSHSNLNGKYLGNKKDSSGILWTDFRYKLSLKFAEMKLRPTL